MSDHPHFWFHCGRCGRLFQDRAGVNEERLCPKCGFDPSLGIAEGAIPAAVTHSAAAISTETPHRGKRGTRKRKNRHFMLKLVAGWLVVLAIIVLGARSMWHVEDTRPHQVVAPADSGPAVTEEDSNLLKQAGPKCNETFGGFLASSTPEERNQFVLDPVATASRMTRFDSMNPIAQIDPATLSQTANSVLHFPGGRAIETRWTCQDGRLFDATFREKNDEWLLDWDHFARYADHPWALFLAGNGPAEGEFRLLARERLAEERKTEHTISLVLYAPRFGYPGEVGFQSPEMLVSRASPDGRLIDAAFQAARKNQTLFRSTLPSIDPDGMIRLRVRVRRSELENERKFEITRVLACHWYSIDDPGVTPAEPGPESTQEPGPEPLPEPAPDAPVTPE